MLRRLQVGMPTVLVGRAFSDGRVSFDGRREDVWTEKPSYPATRSDFPLPRPYFRKTHIEWSMHHGHGGRFGKDGPSREIADFEYEDGTPSPAGIRRHAYKHHQDHLLVQLIRAGAAVERYEAEGLLPRIPGTPEQRDWDPQIPLFLEDMDEHGRSPIPSSHTGSGAGTRDEVLGRMVSKHFENTAAPSKTVNAHAGETLEANTMFDTYDPAAFVSDTITADARRPFWSRRRWALSDNFMLPVSPKPKNTIKDE